MLAVRPSAFHAFRAAPMRLAGLQSRDCGVAIHLGKHSIDTAHHGFTEIRAGRIQDGDRVIATKADEGPVRGLRSADAFRVVARHRLDAIPEQRRNEQFALRPGITQGSFLEKHIRPFFDEMELSKIFPAHIEAFHRFLEERKLSPRTRRTIHAIVGTMFYYAAETLEIIPKSPVKRDFAPKVEPHEKIALTAEQAWKLWDALAGPDTIRNRAFYGVLLFTGIRTGEGLGLKWEDLDFAQRKIHVRRAITRGNETTPKTKASLRVRPMSDHLYTALRNHRAMAHYTAPEDYVFASSTGRSANADDLRTALQNVLRKTLEITLPPREDGLHLLRHTSGSLVFGATGNVKEAQAWLGHSSARITLDTYVHRALESQDQTANVAFVRPTTSTTGMAN
jgi:integrase